MSSSFVPRAVFPNLESLPRSYFLGHHRAALQNIRRRLGTIDLVIECRDYRVPLTSTNPLFEQSLEGRKRLLVYTKRDLGFQNRSEDIRREQVIRDGYQPTDVFYCDFSSDRDVKRILNYTKALSPSAMSLAGMQILVVGMPNVGKSTLLNALRRVGVRKGKAAATGAQPGITRKLVSSVKIAEADDQGASVYLKDSPGVFVPYVPDPETMLKLALCGCVKDTIISPVTVADYLLFHLNQVSPKIYARYSEPTNDIIEFLTAVATQQGRLKTGGAPELEGTALRMVQNWRQGNLGRFVLDLVTAEEMEKQKYAIGEPSVTSYSQAKKAVKRARQEKRTAA